MNSKQINFFITPTDIAEINTFLKGMGSLFLKNNVRTKSQAFIDNIHAESKISKQYYLFPPQYRSDVVFKRMEDGGYFDIDIQESNVIEFTIGGIYKNDGELHRSRFYFVTGYYGDDSKLVKKNSDFIEWADDLKKRFKGRFLKKYFDSTSILFSENSIKWCVENKQS